MIIIKLCIYLQHFRNFIFEIFYQVIQNFNYYDFKLRQFQNSIIEFRIIFIYMYVCIIPTQSLFIRLEQYINY